MTDEVARGLLDAIVAAPDDDAPRLVYADYLSERGDPRGELIQLQCRLAQGPHDPQIAERIEALLGSSELFAELARLELPGHWAGAPQLATIELHHTQVLDNAVAVLRERFTVVEQAG